MNKKIIATALLSTLAVNTASDISAKNKIIEFINNNQKSSIFAGSSCVALPLTLGGLLAINKLNRSSDWFKMLGGTQKDIDDYKNLLKNYDKTVNSLIGNAQQGFYTDVKTIDNDIPRSGELDKKYSGALGRILKICALNNGRYTQGCNFWCALIIKKFANNSDFISEDTEAKIYFVYKNITEALSLFVDKSINKFKTPKYKIYSDLRKNFQNQNKLSDLQIPKLIVDDESNCLAVQSEIFKAFSDFLTENDKMLLIDKLILDATIDGGFNPKIALQTMTNKVYEIIIKYYDKFLVDEKEKLPDDFDAAIYLCVFLQYMKSKLNKN